MRRYLVFVLFLFTVSQSFTSTLCEDKKIDINKDGVTVWNYNKHLQQLRALMTRGKEDKDSYLILIHRQTCPFCRETLKIFNELPKKTKGIKDMEHIKFITFEVSKKSDKSRISEPTDSKDPLIEEIDTVPYIIYSSASKSVLKRVFNEDKGQSRDSILSDVDLLKKYLKKY